jgi:predicted GIY-YIG superfamily endonuclease
MEPTMYFVYELVDPRTDITAYIGITGDPNRRFKEHLGGYGTNDENKDWIKKLQVEGNKPRMKVLEMVENKKVAFKRERHWIKYYTSVGIPLTNIVHSKLKVKKQKSVFPISGTEDRDKREMKSQTQAPEGYYTAAQASKMLNISGTQLRYYVKNGTLRYILPEGKHMGYYFRKDVDELANAWESFQSKYTLYQINR